MGDLVPKWRRTLTASSRLDLAIGIVLTALTQIETWHQDGDSAGTKAWISVALLAATLSLFGRRRGALWCAVVIGAALGFQSMISSTDYQSLGTTLAVVIGLYSAGAYLESPRSFVAWAALVVGLGARELHDLDSYRDNPWDGAFWWLLVTVVFGAGVYVRSRRRASQLRRVARQTEVDSVELARLAVKEERARIARELHDVVAHDVSAVIVQADAAEELLAHDPDLALESVRHIQRMSREALGEMRQALGIMREGAAGPDPAPPPTLEELPALVERNRQTGLPVDLQVMGTCRQLPPGLELSVYRVVQEALTNVRKHTGDAATSVVIEYGRNFVHVTVANEPSAKPQVDAPGGHGLIGMKERADIFGGRLDTGPRPDGGWAVSASFPLAAP